MKRFGKLIFAFYALFTGLFLCNASEVELLKLNNGIPVYIKPSEDSRMCCLQVVIKGGVQYLTPETSGLEASSLKLMLKSSEKYSNEYLKALEYEKPGDFYYYTIQDGSCIGLSSIDKYFDVYFDCFEDLFFNPLFEQKQYDLLKTDLKQSVTSDMNDPDFILWNSAYKIIFQNHPFAATTGVEEESLENITLDAIKKHYQSLIDSRRISIVATGNVNAKELETVLNRKFGKMKAQSYPLKEMEIPEVHVSGEPVVLLHQSAEGGAQIGKFFHGPKVSDPDYGVARVAAMIYSDILFNVVREKNGVCYSVGAGLDSSDAALAYVWLASVSNLKDFSGAVEEAGKIMQSGVVISGKDKNGMFVTEPLENRLEGYKNKYVNGKFMGQAKITGVASRIAASLLQFGDVSSVDEITKTAKNCTKEDVLRVFKKYWVDESSRWFAVVGPEDEDKIAF